MIKNTLQRAGLAAALAFVTFGALAAPVHPPAEEALVEQLRDGGFLLVMRHARSPNARPDEASASPGNTELERQLDETGRSSAEAMGDALARLRIPLGEIYSSPAYRATETVSHLGLGEPHLLPELGPGGDLEDWLQRHSGELPAGGTNALMVTHQGNLSGAFGEQASGMEDGETLIVHRAEDGLEVVGRMPIERWPELASAID